MALRLIRAGTLSKTRAHMDARINHTHSIGPSSEQPYLHPQRMAATVISQYQLSTSQDCTLASSWNLSVYCLDPGSHLASSMATTVPLTKYLFLPLPGGCVCLRVACDCRVLGVGGGASWSCSPCACLPLPVLRSSPIQ